MNKSIIDTRISHPGKTRRARLLLAAAAGLSLAALTTVRATVTIVHSFTGGASDGAAPLASLTLSGSKFYGMTLLGGSSDKGVIFSLNTDGTGFGLLHAFAGSPSDGSQPPGSLTLSGSKLYGMTQAGGSAILGGGAIFSLNTDGTGYTLLHSFATGASDGQGPLGSLTLSGSTLYGMTSQGGINNLGALFSLNTDGTGFSLLHHFTSDGARPEGSLTLSGSKLYGMTNTSLIGGNYGNVFSINTDGTGYTVLHTFTGHPGDGELPRGSLTLSGTKLYGMTSDGGAGRMGTIFSMNTDGTGYGLLHSFNGSDGNFPTSGSLTLSGSVLYGMAVRGGSNNLGTIFSIGIDGTDFSVLESFTGGPADGATPFRGDVTLSDGGSTLYGMTGTGGTANRGIVFSRAIPEPGAFALLGTGTMLLAARRRMQIGSRIASKSPARFHSPTAGMC